MVAPARLIATRVLQRVAHDDAWATPTLDAEIRRGAVKRADAALATQIVYGSLRTAPDLRERCRNDNDWARQEPNPSPLEYPATDPAPISLRTRSDLVHSVLCRSGTPERGRRSGVTAHIVGQEIVVIAGGEGHGVR